MVLLGIVMVNDGILIVVSDEKVCFYQNALMPFWEVTHI